MEPASKPTKKRKYRKITNKLDRCVLRIPKYLVPKWEEMIQPNKISTAKIKLYQYGFTLAARKCGIKSTEEFLGVVYASQVHFSDEEWLKQVHDVGCGSCDRSNSHARDVAKAKLLDNWRQALPETSRYRAPCVTAPEPSETATAPAPNEDNEPTKDM